MRSLFLLTALVTAPARASEAAVPEDPHLWLEDVTGETALDWVRARNAESTGAIESEPGFEALRQRLLSIYDSDARIPYVSDLGGQLYNFWRDAAHPRGMWRRTTLDAYRQENPSWDVVLDLDALADAEGENWVWKGATCLRPDHRRCLVQLSRGGADATVIREFDTVDKAFVDGGFALPEAKSRVGWIDADHLFVATDRGEGSMTTSGYPRTVVRWTRGTPLADAQPIFEGKAGDVSVGAYHDDTPGFERDVVYRAVTFYTDEVFLLRADELVQLDKPDDCEVSLHREWLLFQPRSDWTVGEQTHPAGSLLAARLDRWLKGRRQVDVLFAPTERTSLAGVTPTRNHLVVNVLDNVRNRLEVLTPGKRGWARRPMHGLPELGAVSVGAVDDDAGDDLWVYLSDYVTPSSLLRGSAAPEADAPELLKQLPALFDAKGLVVTQHQTTSADGTKVPYFQVARADLALEGTAPTLLYGYGGFEVSLLPGYRAGVGAAWLEQGGVYVVANIRGGGEFGPRWHQAALKDARHKAYEDFEAVAEDLLARKVTSTPHLGIMGGSNGGLLMGNMYARRPDLWGAIVCAVPLLDMRRYHTLLAGASWMGEYGDPDDPDQWAFIRGFSPYHMVDEATAYPPILIATSTRDDRVHPGHARKMAARLLSWGKDVAYYENIEGGHGGAANNEQAAFMDALEFTFLWRNLR